MRTRKNMKKGGEGGEHARIRWEKLKFIMSLFPKDIEDDYFTKDAKTNIENYIEKRKRSRFFNFSSNSLLEKNNPIKELFIKIKKILLEKITTYLERNRTNIPGFDDTKHNLLQLLKVDYDSLLTINVNIFDDEEKEQIRELIMDVFIEGRFMNPYINGVLSPSSMNKGVTQPDITLEMNTKIDNKINEYLKNNIDYSTLPVVKDDGILDNTKYDNLDNIKPEFIEPEINEYKKRDSITELGGTTKRKRKRTKRKIKRRRTNKKK